MLTTSLAILAIFCATPPAKPGRNLVEPLSNGLRLSMTREEILAKFGTPTEPTWDPHTFGYPTFSVEIGGVDQTIWRLVLKQGVALSSGIQVGSMRNEVVRAFGKQERLIHLQYRLFFGFSGDRLMRIEIEPSSGEFTPSPKALKHDSASTGREGTADLVGSWHGSNVNVEITLRADGTYVWKGEGGGQYRVDGDRITFTGPLNRWNRGRGRRAGRNIEFHWKEADGTTRYIALSNDVEGKDHSD